MNTQDTGYCMWSLGLSSRDEEQIRACMSENHHLVVLPEGVTPALREAERDEPVLAWIGKSFWRRVQAEQGGAFRFMEHVSQVLVLPEACSREDLEDALKGSFQGVLMGTGNKERIHEVLGRSLEVSNTYKDMGCMTRELLMSRELLSRKCDVFGFLQDFIVRVAKCHAPKDILSETHAALAALLPLSAMHMAVWQRQPDNSVSMNLYLDAPQAHGAREAVAPAVKAWTDLLLSSATTLAPFLGASLQISTYYSGNTVKIPSDEGSDSLPDSGRTLLLPLCGGGVFCGVMALLLDREYPLGRDQVQALDAATTHLAVALRAATPQSEGEDGYIGEMERTPRQYETYEESTIKQ